MNGSVLKCKRFNILLQFTLKHFCSGLILLTAPVQLHFFARRLNFATQTSGEGEGSALVRAIALHRQTYTTVYRLSNNIGMWCKKSNFSLSDLSNSISASSSKNCLFRRLAAISNCQLKLWPQFIWKTALEDFADLLAVGD